MDRVAFLFAGQGDQTAGMGKDLAARSETAAKVFQVCDRLRPGTSQMCFEGPEEELKKTVNTQPCLFAFELAAAQDMRARGVCPDAVAGFSLGEVAAATFAGAFNFQDGFRAVCRRGRLMQEAGKGKGASMAAVLKLPAEAVRKLAEGFSEVWPVNFNCPGQTTVSGTAEQLESFAERVRQEGGRVIWLKVSGAFHSPLMAPAAESFLEYLQQIPVKTTDIPIWSDRTGCRYEPGEEAFRHTLASQIDHPVLWEKLIRSMAQEGIDTFVEIGPGQTLTHLVQRILPDSQGFGLEDYKKECGF